VKAGNDTFIFQITLRTKINERMEILPVHGIRRRVSVIDAASSGLVRWTHCEDLDPAVMIETLNDWNYIREVF
jgi:hypothetical protein